MDTALPQKFTFILDRNLAKANCTRNNVCTFCDKVVLDIDLNKKNKKIKKKVHYYIALSNISCAYETTSG